MVLNVLTLYQVHNRIKK